MLFPLVVFIAALTQQPRDFALVTQTLDLAVKNVFPDHSYTVEFTQDLQEAPVVYTITKRTDPKTDLKNFCKALFLETEFDEQKKTVKIMKSQFLYRHDRKAEIEKSLGNIRELLSPMIKTDPQQINQRIFNLLRASDTETDKNEMAELRRKIDLMSKLLDTKSIGLLQALLSNKSASSILSSTCTSSNNLGLREDALHYVSQYLAGRGKSWTDYLSKVVPQEGRAGLLELAESERKRGFEIGEKEPLTIVKHNLTENGIKIELNFVPPNQVIGGTSIVIQIGDPRKPGSTNIPALAMANQFEPKSLWEPNTLTINSLGVLAQDLEVNFASWLSPFSIRVEGKTNFAWYQTFNPGLSANLENEWLSIFNARQPLILTSKAWKPFLRLREMLDSKHVSRSILLKTISAMSEVQLRRLEELGTDFNGMPARYFAISSGVRLFKAYLTCLETKPGNSPFDHKFTFDQLPKEAKKDFLGFFSSALVWQKYTQLLHSKNQHNLSEAVFNMGYDPETGDQGNYIQIYFPQHPNIISHESPMIFRIYTKNMVP